MLFVASIRPFKISKIWKTRYQNTCNWDSFWWLFHYTRQIAMGTQIISISWNTNEARALNHSMCFGSWIKINPFITKYSQNKQFWNTLITVSKFPYPYYDLWNNQADIVIYLSIMSWSSSCIDDSDKSPSKDRYEATNARLIPRLQSLVHSPAKLRHFGGRTAAALIWRLI